MTGHRPKISLYIIFAFHFWLFPAFAFAGPTDTLLLRLSHDFRKWPYELHSEPAWGSLPGLLLPVNTPPGITITSAALIVDETLKNVALGKEEEFPSEFLLQLRLYDSRNLPVTSLVLLPFREQNGEKQFLSKGRIVLYYDSLHLTGHKVRSELVSNSVLSNGRWLKVAVIHEGVHKITAADLAAAGWDPSKVDPRRLALFGNGGAMLPERNNAFRYDDLIENPVWVTGEADGSFDQGDALYFFGQETTQWSYNPMTIRYDHRINYYSDSTFYFLTMLDRPGLRIAPKAQASANPNTEVDIFLDYQLHENDLVSLIHSGREWYGEAFNRNENQLDLAFEFPHRVAQRPVMVNTQLATRSLTETTAFSIELNGQTALPQQSFPAVLAGAAAFAREQSYNLSLNIPPGDSLKFVVMFHAAHDNSKGWINYLRVNAWRQLRYTSGRQLLFRNPEAVGFNLVAKYRISHATPNLKLWDVSNPIRPASQEYDAQNDMIVFSVLGDSIRQYVLFDPVDALIPAALSAIPNQNLHAAQAADMVIVAPAQFMAQAESIAQLHLVHDGLESVVAAVHEIYNEFGSGKPDPTAIRDFIRMLWQRSGDRLRYVVLFGDASYDYKNRLPGNTNLIPTYQSIQSNIETQSFVSDDYFGLMGGNEGQDMQGILDLGIGRFPVSTMDEANLMVQKNMHYLSGLERLRGSWQQRITFMADDGDGNLHLSQAETLAMHVDTAFKKFNIRKVYLDAYRRVAVPGGFRYPDAASTLLKNISEGSLIVNYTGHGGVSGLTDEKVFSVNEIENLTNIDRLAFFVTATCEFSRFDNPSLTSAGERLLLNPNGGAIALMTTTRLAFAHSNFNVNRRLYASLMTQGKGDINRLGDIIRLSKNPTNSYIYNFVLLGNPALRLSYPEYSIEVTSINEKPTDTLHAMSEVRLAGRIIGRDGLPVEQFNGIVEIMFFDKKSTYRTLGNDAMSMPTNFSLYDKLLFKGRASVVEGLFSIAFSLPRSISYNYGQARISLFASDTLQRLTAGGWKDDIFLGGVDPNIKPDETGPQIVLQVGEARPGFEVVVSPNTVLFAEISDPQGIHFLGTEIGRDIVATHYQPDGTQLKYVLNNHFSLHVDQPTAGSLQFPLNNLKQGRHRLVLKAWDLHNNSAEKEVSFVVNPTQNLVLTNVHVSPNPVWDQAVFTFLHNKPGQQLLTTLEIFDLIGNRIYLSQNNMTPRATLSEPILFKVSSLPSSQLSAGVYLWRLTVKADEGLPISVSGRIIVGKL